jgi:hypothetical protein
MFVQAPNCWKNLLAQLHHHQQHRISWTLETLEAETQEAAEVEVTPEDPRNRATTKDLARDAGLISQQAKSGLEPKSIQTRNSLRSNSDRDSAKTPPLRGWGLLLPEMRQINYYTELNKI